MERFRGVYLRVRRVCQGEVPKLHSTSTMSRSTAMTRRVETIRQSSANRLYRALDARIVCSGGSMWRISVFSVVIDADGHWVQLALFGPSRLNLLLRLHEHADVRDVLSALESRLSQPDPAEGSVVMVSGAGDDADAQSAERGISRHVHSGVLGHGLKPRGCLTRVSRAAL